MKSFKKNLVVFILLAILLTAFYWLWFLPRYSVPILMYHRFGYEESTLFVTPKNFENQMRYIRDKGYNVISLDELVSGIKQGRKFKHNTVVITIDDGYEDNYIYAYPILKKYNFPAIIFITANAIDNQKDFLRWDEIKSMAKDNISFGAHTKNHVYLPSIKEPKTLRDETAGCKKLIEDKIGKTINYFCYPSGGFTKEAKIMLKKAGYKGACTTNRGFSKGNRDVYELKRVKVTNSDAVKPFHFWAKLSGYYNIFRSKKKGY